jgi:hypothetical protein
LDGWRISHDFILTSQSVSAPDITGFYHAVAYWMTGTQDRYAIFQKRLADHLGGQLPQMSRDQQNSSRLLNVENKNHFSVGEIKKAFQLVFDGRKPDKVVYTTAATMLRVTFVEVVMGPSPATWMQYSPTGYQNTAFPCLYFIFNSTSRRFQIMWAPKIHQPVVGPENADLQTRLSGNTTLFSDTQSPPSLHHSLPVQIYQPSEKSTLPNSNPDTLPPEKRFKILQTGEKPILTLESYSMPTIEDLKTVNFGPASGIHIYHQKDSCNPQCRAVAKTAYFELGNFKYVGWRFSINLFPDNKDSIWRALSFWIYGSQARHNEIRMSCETRPHVLNDQLTDPPEFHSSEIPGLLRAVSIKYRARIVFVWIHDGIAHLREFHPRYIDEDDERLVPRNYFIYSWKGRFGIFYCHHHL